MQIQAGSIGLLTISFVIYRICTVEPDKSPRQLFRKKKAIAHPKKSKSLIITPGVDFEKPICSFLIVKKRFDEYSDSASKTISLLRKIQTNFSKRVFCFRTRRSIFAHFLSLSIVPGLWVFCEWSWDLFIVIRQLVKRFMSKQHSLLLFLFSNEGHIVDKKNFGLQVCFIWYNKPIVQILSFAS